MPNLSNPQEQLPQHPIRSDAPESLPNVFFISIQTRFDNLNAISVDQLMTLCGLNTGNLLFTNAVSRQIRCRHSEAQFHFNPKDINHRFDFVVIPAANWLNERFDIFSGLASLVEQLTIPVIIIGVGAQASDEGQLPNVPKDTVRLMRAIADRSVRIGARGEFSKDVLHHYGIKNVEVIGCPSLYWHGNKRLKVRKADELSKLALGGTGYAGSYFSDQRATASQICQRNLYRFAFKEKISFVYQSERPEIDFLISGDECSLHDDVRDNVLWYYHADSPKEWFQYVETYGKCFFDVDQWIRTMAGFDFYIGSRVHGVIAALLAGTPACLLTHDSRTRELARFAGIPTRNLAACGNLSRELVQKVFDDVDYTDWEQGHIDHLPRYARFLEDNGLPHHLCESENDRV